jgi:hypothetical protein
MSSYKSVRHFTQSSINLEYLYRFSKKSTYIKFCEIRSSGGGGGDMSHTERQIRQSFTVTLCNCAVSNHMLYDQKLLANPKPTKMVAFVTDFS